MFGRPPVRVAFFVYLQDERFVHVGVVLSKWGRETGHVVSRSPRTD